MTTCSFGLGDTCFSISSSDPCGETNLAVGRGPVFDGPRDFLRMGCGIGAMGFLWPLDEDAGRVFDVLEGSAAPSPLIFSPFCILGGCPIIN